MEELLCAAQRMGMDWRWFARREWVGIGGGSGTEHKGFGNNLGLTKGRKFGLRVDPLKNRFFKKNLLINLKIKTNNKLIFFNPQGL